MPSGQVIVNGALTTLGILEQGGTPSTSDSTDALNELNNLWGSWSIDEGLIMAERSEQFALTSSIGSYTIGPTGVFSTQTPARLYKAFFVNAGGRNELDVVNAERYYSHNDLSAAAVAPDECYLDFNIDSVTGLESVKIWPVVSVSSTFLELLMGAKFVTWNLVTNYNIPPGYQDAINYALAFRLIPRYGVAVNPEIVQTVTVEAQKAELRLRTANAMNRQRPLESMFLQPPQPAAAAR